uniref:Uncharacterized protein n=1 Tax=Fagus sylvatica TaxID=28930 RepID=A0A2N9I4F4_FAGSY
MLLICGSQMFINCWLFQILKHKKSLLEASNAELQWELQERKVTSEHLTQRALDAQVEKDQLAMKIESARNGKSWDEIDSSSNQAEMKRFASVDTSVLKQHYEKKVHELEQEKKSLQKEIEELRCNLSNISSTSDDGAQKLKEEYLQKLNVLESQVLQRETEEASMATKRLKELLECRKASSRETFGAGNGNGPRIQALEHELEVTVLVHEVRAEYERQLEERARMAKEVARLKEEADLLRQSRLR